MPAIGVALIGCNYMSQGYLYVLINPSIPELAKVGKTIRDPVERAAELSSASGIPSPFIVVFQQPVLNCHAAEKWVHEELDLKGYRHSVRREFFTGPLHEIVRVVSIAGSMEFSCRDSSAVESESVDDDDQNSLSRLVIAEDLYQAGIREEQGSVDKMPSEAQAHRYYTQAAKMGHILACLAAGRLASTADEALAMYSRCVAEGGIIGLWFISETHRRHKSSISTSHLLNEYFNRASEYSSANPSDNRFRDELKTVCRSYFRSVAIGEREQVLSSSLVRLISGIVIEAIDDRVADLQKDPKCNEIGSGPRIEFNQLLRARSLVLQACG